MLYFFILDGPEFLETIGPALAQSWQRRSFEPCRELCAALVPRAKGFFPGSEHGQHQLLVEQVGRGLTFDRRFWQPLVGEVLMYSAIAVPRLETAAETLCCLLAPEHFRDRVTARARLAAIQQAHFGSRDLVFGGGHYRPESAGWNDTDEVARLADYLAAQTPEQWTSAGLASLEVYDDSEREAELDYARHWFLPLCDMYRDARDAGQIIVCEDL
ncbi:MAG: hypothetical protein FJ271_16140 [Planctomycetes bacterium]|nr:hypothetical protein [Planctomycetota bacterium]